MTCILFATHREWLDMPPATEACVLLLMLGVTHLIAADRTASIVSEPRGRRLPESWLLVVYFLLVIGWLVGLTVSALFSATLREASWGSVVVRAVQFCLCGTIAAVPLLPLAGLVRLGAQRVRAATGKLPPRP
jgi:hypothetical protein